MEIFHKHNETLTHQNVRTRFQSFNRNLLHISNYYFRNHFDYYYYYYLTLAKLLFSKNSTQMFVMFKVITLNITNKRKRKTKTSSIAIYIVVELGLTDFLKNKHVYAWQRSICFSISPLFVKNKQTLEKKKIIKRYLEEGRLHAWVVLFSNWIEFMSFTNCFLSGDFSCCIESFKKKTNLRVLKYL